MSDEVFAPFALKDDGPANRPSVLACATGELVFALNGLSKIAALPQMKLGWIAVGGTSASKVTEALARLELVADAFLSVGTPVQLAAPELLDGRHVTQAAIQQRLLANLAVLRARVAGSAVTLLDVEGGWYATLRVPRVETEEAWSLLFLEEDQVYVHPGHFFDFPEEAYVVLSLLTPETTFLTGVERLVARVFKRLAADVRTGT